ncbi:hypothetical protein AB6A23_22920 [Paenibacillus tarimensis]
MRDAWIIPTACAFFALCFVMVRSILMLLAERGSKQVRLRYHRQARLMNRMGRLLSRYERPYRHLSELLEAMRWPFDAGAFLLMSALAALTGTAGGAVMFQSWRGALLMGLLFGSALYLWLRFSQINRQLKTRMDFLPAVELFYQCYLITGERQIRTALQRMVEERRLLGPMQSDFEQLYRNLSVKGDDESSLRIFSASLGHLWGDYFVQIIRVALAEGNPVADNLKELITDMRKARRANQQERNRLLEIRIANFSPLFFLALFVGINVRYNPEQAYTYYVLDPNGRDMLLHAFVLIFVSFGMGLYLSRKKM